MKGRGAPFVALVAGTIIAGALLCSVARAQEHILRPYWTGAVWGAFTDAGPDSIQGPRAELQVPVGVRLTDPISIMGHEVTLRARFQWTTKAYLGEESEPLRDATYEWFPLVHIQPDTADGFWRYLEAGPDHISNGDEGALSRSMNAVSGEAAFVWQWAGITFDAYVKAWYVYEFGENTAPLGDTITLLDDFGAKVLVRGSLSMIELAGEFGPDWQKGLAYIPLDDFYHFGVYAEIHNGEGNSFLNPTQSGTFGKVGLALEPPHL